MLIHKQMALMSQLFFMNIAKKTHVMQKKSINVIAPSKVLKEVQIHNHDELNLN